LLTVSPIEYRPAFTQRIDIRAVYLILTVATELGPQVVKRDEQDIDFGIVSLPRVR
jgi:hypothetical protein